MERTTGIEPAIPPWEGGALPLRHIRMEPFPGADPGTASIPRTRGRRSERHVLGAQDSNLKPAAPRAAALARLSYRPSRAAVRCRAEPPALQERGRSRARRPVCPRPDLNRHCPPPQGGASCRWATRTWSRYPVPTRIIRRTKAEPRAARIGMASGAGLEPAGAGLPPVRLPPE